MTGDPAATAPADGDPGLAVPADEQGTGLARSTVELAAVRLLSLGAFLAVSLLAARLLGPAELGSAAVAQTIGTIVALVANGGLSMAATYFLRRGPAEADRLIRRISALALASAALAAFLVLLFAPALFVVIIGDPAWGLVAATLLFAVATVGFEVAGATVLGLDRPRAYAVAEAGRGIGSLLAVVVLLPVWPADAGLLIGLALGYAMGAALSVRFGEPRAVAHPRIDRSFSVEVLRFGLRGQVGNVLQFLALRLDLLLVPALLSLPEAGVYVVAVRVAEVVSQAATASATLVFPHVAGQAERRATIVTERATRLTLVVVAGAALAIALIAVPGVPLLFGPAYAGAVTPLLILLVAMLPLSTGRIMIADLKGRGRPGLVSWCAVAGMAATVVLDLVLIPTLGIEGAALASLVAYGVHAAVLLLAFRAVTGGTLSSLVPRASDAAEVVAIARRLARPASR